MEAEAAEQEAEACGGGQRSAICRPFGAATERQGASVRRMQRRSQSTKRPAKKQRVQSSNDSSDIRLYRFVVISSL